MKRTSFSLALVLAAAPALAQERYAGDPLAGLALPAAPLAGDHGATAVVANPAGLPFLDGAHLEVVTTSRSGGGVQAAGAGVGVYLGVPLALPVLPRLGLGLRCQVTTAQRRLERGGRVQPGHGA